MRFEQFHNGLRVLLNIDADELWNAGIIEHGDLMAYQGFSRDPFRWLIRADDDTAKKLWTLMQTRMIGRIDD